MLKTCIFVITALFLSTNALAEWELVNDDSTVNYVSIKKSAVGEVNGFGRLSGAIESDGSMSVDIDLGSVETNIPIRDDRTKTMLFEVASYSKAAITAALDLKTFNEMKVGDTYRESVSFKLSLHGVAKELVTNVRVVKLSQNGIMAVSETPIIISADDYNLAEGIEKLREVASLPSISTAVPVTFSLVFRQQ
jgi:polyisoprenoid-binding protein YceI